MNKIPIEQQKQIMLNILKYFDKVCRENNIQYSLIGGSLIGAVRHKGIIPWDDDIDVILSRNNYNKIINILKNDKSSDYKLMSCDINSSYHFPFCKLIDVSTIVVEPTLREQIDGYGVFIDIFCYNNLPNNEKIRKRYFKRIQMYGNLLSRKNYKKGEYFRNILRLGKNIVSKLCGYKRILKKLDRIFDNLNDIETEFVVSSWPIYSYQKEIQLRSNTLEYINVQFEDMIAMIYKNYDPILKTTFGDYMKLPPEEKRINHGLIAYWRD